MFCPRCGANANAASFGPSCGTQLTQQNQPASPSSAAAVPSATVAPKKKSTKRRSSGPGDVRGLRAGLFCRDLMASGYSYVAAIDYWRMHGQPDKMDADGNGIPCETVYPAYAINVLW
jgi:hypothetical protein